jgi:hypothetical protein
VISALLCLSWLCCWPGLWENKNNL